MSYAIPNERESTKRLLQNSTKHMAENKNDLLGDARALAIFAGSKLTTRIAKLENQFSNASDARIQELLGETEISHNLLASAYAMKRVAGQINVTIHAIAILLCLPRILVPGEQIQSMSLGAGNTGKPFDLETDRRVAEFKFIHWQGGTETIRQNSLFKDLYQLAESPSSKDKYMYVLGTQHPLKFLNGGRALSSVMSRNRKLWDDFHEKYGTRMSTVADYYRLRGDSVNLVDVSPFLPELVNLDAPETSDGVA